MSDSVRCSTREMLEVSASDTKGPETRRSHLARSLQDRPLAAFRPVLWQAGHERANLTQGIGLVA